MQRKSIYGSNDKELLVSIVYLLQDEIKLNKKRLIILILILILSLINMLLLLVL